MNRIFYCVTVFLFVVYPVYSRTYGGYIEISHIANTADSYSVNLYLLSYLSSSTMPSGTLDFGDGNSVDLIYPDEVLRPDPATQINIYHYNHSYAGPGIFKLSFREANRNPGIILLPDSVYAPFYIETSFVIDPFMGFTSPPKIHIDLTMNTVHGLPLVYSLVASGSSPDSLSYSPVIPESLNGKDVSGYIYRYETKYSGDPDPPIITTAAGDILYQNPVRNGFYNYALRIDEWRKVLNQAVNISYMILDFNVNIDQTETDPFSITGLQDTVFLVGKNSDQEFRIEGKQGDSIMANLYSGIPEGTQVKLNMPDTGLLSLPVEGKIAFSGTSVPALYQPSKIVLSVADISRFSVRSYRSFFVWFSESPSSPEPPSDLSIALAFRNRIKLQWKDNSFDEAGFKVERADSYNPDFIRIAALSRNTTEFTDYNVLQDRDYYYRVTAMGTERSAESDILTVNRSEIVEGINENPETSFIRLYPVPARNDLNVEIKSRNISGYRVTICDLNGRVWKSLEIIHGNSGLNLTLDISGLEAGEYILSVSGTGYTESRRFMKSE